MWWTSKRTPVVVLLLLLFSSRVAEASPNVYTSGDIILANPIEASTIFLFVVCVSAALEFGIQYASGIKNKYFTIMFTTVNQEVMIIGLLVLILSFAESLVDWPARWIVIFKWSMMCLFFMMVAFVVMVVTMLGAVHMSNNYWTKFEAEKIDSGLKLWPWERQYKECFAKFQVSIAAFGYDSGQGVKFSSYLSKLQRRNVISLTEFTWVSWICLATLIIINALRAELTRRVSEFGDENIEDAMSQGQRVINYLSFIAIGYVIFAAFVALLVSLSLRLKAFCSQRHAVRRVDASNPDVEIGMITEDELDDSRAHLFRRSREATIEVVQVVVLSFEWYVSAFFLSYSYQITTSLEGAAAPIFLLAILPVAFFLALLPWVLIIITMLSYLGTNFDEQLVQHLIESSAPIRTLSSSVELTRKAQSPRTEAGKTNPLSSPKSPQQQRPLPQDAVVSEAPPMVSGPRHLDDNLMAEERKKRDEAERLAKQRSSVIMSATEKPAPIDVYM